jgi:PAP2 superfamily/Protein of unknown function (DUF4232)
MAAATAATWTLTRRSARSWARGVRPWAKELTLILVLYGMWQYAGAWSLGRRSVAVARGQSIWDWERALHLPSERTVQLSVLHHRLLMRGLNEYYAVVHVPALAACLIWLFVRHRDRYPEVRTVVALVTGASLVMQMFPVAPPRLLANLGIVDTGALIGPNVYARGAPGLDQLSAMPSLHVGWAIVVAGAVVWVGRSSWRWLALLYPALTMYAVVVTGNHYWADGIVAAALCAGATLMVARMYIHPAVRAAQPDITPEPVLAPAHGLVARSWTVALVASILLAGCSGGARHPTLEAIASCFPGSLDASVQSFAAAAGHDFYLVVLTNVGLQPCALVGTPGVTFLDANIQEIGSPSGRSGPAGSLVVLPSNQSASAELITTPSRCDSDQVPNIHVCECGPPGSRGRLDGPGSGRAVRSHDPGVAGRHHPSGGPVVMA